MFVRCAPNSDQTFAAQRTQRSANSDRKSGCQSTQRPDSIQPPGRHSPALAFGKPDCGVPLTPVDLDWTGHWSRFKSGGNKMNSLVKFWSKCKLDKPPYIHPDDCKLAKSQFDLFDFKVRTPAQFIKSEKFGDFKDRSFHLSLYPGPYIGHLDTAKIVILMLNPGLGFSDYTTDNDAEHARWIKKVIRQDLANAEFPFISLNPEFSWTGGFRWWEGKLRKTLTCLAEKNFRGSYFDALQYLSKQMACIEMVPYHSRGLSGSSLIKQLPSVQAAREYVSEVLGSVPR